MEVLKKMLIYGGLTCMLLIPAIGFGFATWYDDKSFWLGFTAFFAIIVMGVFASFLFFRWLFDLPLTASEKG